MSIFSFSFWAFAAVITLLYFLVPRKMQWVVILAGNVFFYAHAGIGFLLLMGMTSLICYGCALRLEGVQQISKTALRNMENGEEKTEVKKQLLSIRKFLCGVAIFSAGGVWAILKYSDFLLSNLNRVLSWIGLTWSVPMVSWVLPLGISFYTFHMIGYVVDVYRGKYPAERNYARFFAFVSFFPHIIQGPFTRYNELGRSLGEPHSFSWDRLCEGCARILWGLSLKLIIADRLDITVQTIFAQYQEYSGFHVFFAMILYCIELYADFSGYMNIICGLSHIWGIELPENFRQPYFARSVDEFWRRWHITLGAWFKDYVFYPVSMGKVGQKLGRSARKKWGARMGKLVPGYFALIFVWTATGLWHGANWTFLIWGYLNLFVILLSMQLAPVYEKMKNVCHIRGQSLVWQLFSILRTFGLVCFFRFFSAQPSVSASIATLKHSFAHLNFHGMANLEQIFKGIPLAEIYVVLLLTAVMLVVDILREHGAWDRVRRRCPMPVRNLCYASLIILLVLLVGGSTDLTGSFMYANF